MANTKCCEGRDREGVEMTLSIREIEDPEISSLLEKCRKAKEHAYCPYSRFPVGAALLCDDGTVFTGCNMENAAYPDSICAERVAIGKAVSEGYRKFKAIAVTSNMVEDFISPCGSCRQVLAEFGRHWDVYMTKGDSSCMKVTVTDMLPYSFTVEALRDGQSNKGRTTGCNNCH